MSDHPSSDPDVHELDDVLEAFNASGIVEHPNQPEEPEGGPADDTDAQPPG